MPESPDQSRLPAHTPPHQAEPHLVTVTEDRAEAFFRAVMRGFHERLNPGDLELELAIAEYDRLFGHQVDGRWISTCGAYSRRMTTPGGQVPVAAVTVVSVAPGYRRRGLLREMMISQLADVRQRGTEPVALLWASEALIYGRFGYGQAVARIGISGRTRDTAFLPGVGLGTGSADEVSRQEFLAVAPGLRESWLAERPGHLDRTEGWWANYLDDAEHRRRGAGELRFVLHYGSDGDPDGFATFRIKEQSTITEEGAEVVVGELDAADAAGYAALWRWLLDLDLVRAFSRRNAPVDEPLRQLVANPRALTCQVSDSTYARILDVPAALSARGYARETDLVIEVSDEFQPDLAGRYRLRLGTEGAEVNRTDASADLAMTARHFGSIYLGGISPTELHRAGLIGEHTPGSALTLSAAFTSARAPFCPDSF